MERGCDPPFIRRCGGPVTHPCGGGETGGAGGGGGGCEGQGEGGRGPLGTAPRVGWLACNLLEGTQQTSCLRSSPASPGLWESGKGTVRERNLDNGDGTTWYLHGPETMVIVAQRQASHVEEPLTAFSHRLVKWGT